MRAIATCHELKLPVEVLTQTKDRPSHLCFDLDVKASQGGRQIAFRCGLKGIMNAICYGLYAVLPSSLTHHKQKKWEAWVYSGCRPDKPVSYHVHFPYIQCATKRIKQDITRAMVNLGFSSKRYEMDPAAVLLHEMVDPAAIHGGLRVPYTCKLGNAASFLRFEGVWRPRGYNTQMEDVTPDPPPSIEDQIRMGMQWEYGSKHKLLVVESFTPKAVEEEETIYDPAPPEKKTGETVEEPEPDIPIDDGYDGIDLCDERYAFVSLDKYAADVARFCATEDTDGLERYFRRAFHIDHRGDLKAYLPLSSYRAERDTSIWTRIGNIKNPPLFGFLTYLNIRIAPDYIDDEADEAGHINKRRKNKETHITAFELMRRMRRHYLQPVYHPDPPYQRVAHIDAHVNAWFGWLGEHRWPGGMHPVHDWRMDLGSECLYILQYIWRDVVSQETRSFHALLAWFAHVVQFPFKLSEKSPIIIGEEGCGKTFMFKKIVQHILGTHHAQSVEDSRALVGDFQYHDKLSFVHIDEGKVNPAHNERLKNMLTARTKTVNKKYEDPFMCENYINVAYTANQGPVTLQRNNRRYFYCQANVTTHVKNRGNALEHHFNFLDACFQSECGGHDLWSFFLSLDTDFVHRLPNAAFNDLHRRERYRVMSGPEKWYYNSLRTGRPFTTEIGWNPRKSNPYCYELPFVLGEVSRYFLLSGHLTIQALETDLSVYGVRQDGQYIVLPNTLQEARQLFVEAEPLFATVEDPSEFYEREDLNRMAIPAEGKEWETIQKDGTTNEKFDTCMDCLRFHSDSSVSSSSGGFNNLHFSHNKIC